jgi:hypothetical protein
MIGYFMSLCTLLGVYQYRIAGFLYAVHYVRNKGEISLTEASILALPMIYPPLVLLSPLALFFLEHDGPRWALRELNNFYYTHGWRLFGPVAWKRLAYIAIAREYSVYGVIIDIEILPYMVCFLSGWSYLHLLKVTLIYYFAFNLAQNYGSKKKKPVAYHTVIEDYEK